MSRSAGLVALMVLIALPGLVGGLMLARLVRHPPDRHALLLWRAGLALPAVLAPAAWAMLRLQPGQRRTAIGLGAGRLDRLRHLWLPQLGPPLLASLLLAGLLIAGGLLLAG